MKPHSVSLVIGKLKKKSMRYYPIPIQMAITQKEEEKEEEEKDRCQVGINGKYWQEYGEMEPIYK